jgi:hypothetical protein
VAYFIGRVHGQSSRQQPLHGFQLSTRCHEDQVARGWFELAAAKGNPAAFVKGSFPSRHDGLQRLHAVIDVIIYRSTLLRGQMQNRLDTIVRNQLVATKGAALPRAIENVQLPVRRTAVIADFRGVEVFSRMCRTSRKEAAEEGEHRNHLLLEREFRNALGEAATLGTRAFRSLRKAMRPAQVLATQPGGRIVPVVLASKDQNA